MCKCGIYKITNQINGKVYIGQSIKIEERWKQHKKKPFLKSSEGYNSPLYQAIRKYGLENFKFEILEECSPEDLNQKEIDYISLYESYPPSKDKGYNQTPGGDSGKQFKLEKEQISLILKDLKESNLTIKEIANKFQISIYAIYDFNKGIYYKDDNFQYPIRQVVKSKNICPGCGKEISFGALSCKKCYSKVKNLKKDKPKIRIRAPYIKKNKKLLKCPICGGKISNTTDKICNNCFRKEGVEWNSPFRTSNSLVKIPPKEDILKDLYEFRKDYLVAEKYKISTMLLKNWKIKLGIPRKRKEVDELYEKRIFSSP